MTHTLELITRLRAHASRMDTALASVDGRATADFLYYLGGNDPQVLVADLRAAADRLARSAAKGLDELLAESSPENP